MEDLKKNCASASGFTLLELLVVCTVIGLLVGLLLPAIISARDAARVSQCAGHMRQLGMAVALYSGERDGIFPRSQHSAFANGELVWSRAVARYLGEDETRWTNLLRGVYHCPSDSRARMLSYGVNVYFELGPDDDYEGKPSTWRYRSEVPHPARTILFAENNSLADHIMPNFWAGLSDVADVAYARHRGSANYVFVDGHVERRKLQELYDPARSVDLWHPLRAR